MTVPIRLVIESSYSIWEVSCFAADHSLIFHTYVPVSDNSPEEVIWSTRDGQTRLHRLEDQFAGIVYLLLDGAGAKALAASAVEKLDGLDTQTLAHAMSSHDSAALSAPAIAALGVLAPRTFDLVFFDLFRWVLHHPDEEIRRAAIKATAYAPWPELATELQRLASEDEVDDIRTLAGHAASLIQSQTAAEP